MTEPVRLAIVGTGGIGSLHAELAAKSPAVELVGLSSLDDDAPGFADRLETTLVRDYRQLAELNLDGVIVAAPNQLHLEIGRFFAEGGVHLLVEKPIADTRSAGRELCAAAERNGVHLLVGHHRRHHSLVRAAKRAVAEDLGTLVATNTMVTMRKPDSYYEVEWRRAEGAGPLLVNLIHEVDLLRAVCGEIESVQAASAKVGRGFAFDDTATILLHFANGALGTMVISESTPSPWSWEASVSDGMGHHNAGQDHGRFVGTRASLSFPSLTLWEYGDDADAGWYSPLHARRLDVARNNPYVEQIEHLAEVIRGAADPIASGLDGLRSLCVVDAVIEAATTGAVVSVEALYSEH